MISSVTNIKQQKLNSTQDKCVLGLSVSSACKKSNRSFFEIELNWKMSKVTWPAFLFIHQFY